MVVGVLLTVTLGLWAPDKRLKGKGVSVGDSGVVKTVPLRKLTATFRVFQSFEQHQSTSSLLCFLRQSKDDFKLVEQACQATCVKSKVRHEGQIEK